MYGSSLASTSQSTFSGMNSSSGGGAVVSASEQASADLILLQQNLAKSKRVTTRMTALLTSFDDRLARLDKSVVPIHRSTRDLSKVQRNVEAALLALDSVLGANDLVDREQEIIDRLPDRDGLAVYQASITRLKAAQDSMERNAAAAAAASSGFASVNKGKEKEGTLARMKDLIETGCERLGGLFLETVENVSPKSGWPDITAWDQGTPLPNLIPDEAIHLLKGLLSFIQTIMGEGSPLELDLQNAYGETRGIFMAATLNQVGREAVDGVEVQTRAGNLAAGRMPAFGRRVFGRFLDAMFAMAKSEHALAGTIFGKQLANQVHKSLIQPVMTIFTATGTSVNSAIKKTLTTSSTSVGLAYTCYTELTLSQRIDNFEDWIRNKASRKENELAQLSHAFKATCLRALPDYIEETKKFGQKALSTPQDQTNAGISPTTINVVNFAKQISDFPDTAENFLQTLGDGNWLPGGGVPGSKRGGNNPGGEGGEFALLSKYLGDVIQTLFSALDARARALASVRGKESGGLSASGVLTKSHNNASGPSTASNRQSAGLSAIFMLNNISYVRRELLLNSNVPDLLASNGGAASRRGSASTTQGGSVSMYGGDVNIEDELNKRHRNAKSAYLEIFSPLVSCLMDVGMSGDHHHGASTSLKNVIGVGGNNEKKDTKDRFGRFNEALEDVEALHRIARLDRNETDLRERVKDEVVRMCVPTYASFVKRHDNFSKNPSKYLRVDPAGLQARLESLFEPISKSDRVMGRM
ncbi:hypothetical protein P389DRAFT_78 [Cystobasidium minutum MCA 4210]|uniref:uncharacterized protein n=1 Tax=Cystobasidium minutum MCA 4210 TaxID=1397322 RepID=UPI0034CFFCCF|eukprot:jgi/Rhomi1/78/CE77_1550